MISEITIKIAFTSDGAPPGQSPAVGATTTGVEIAPPTFVDVLSVETIPSPPEVDDGMAPFFPSDGPPPPAPDSADLTVPDIPPPLLGDINGAGGVDVIPPPPQPPPTGKTPKEEH
jgi:hypothetical protein